MVGGEVAKEARSHVGAVGENEEGHWEVFTSGVQDTHYKGDTTQSVH